MYIDFISYRKKKILLKGVKIFHFWKIDMNKKNYIIELSEYFFDNNICLKIENEKIFESKKFLEEKKKNGIFFEFRNLKLKIKKKDNKNFDLYINLKKFEEGKKIILKYNKKKNNVKNFENLIKKKKKKKLK